MHFDDFFHKIQRYIAKTAVFYLPKKENWKPKKESFPVMKKKLHRIGITCIYTANFSRKFFWSHGTILGYLG